MSDIIVIFLGIPFLLFAVVGFFSWHPEGKRLMRQWFPYTIGGAADAAPPMSLASITRQLREQGVEDVSFSIAIDWTESNEMNGSISYGGRSLHDVSHGVDVEHSPYQRSIATIVETLTPLDSDKRVPVYIFGDAESRGHSFKQLGEEVDCSAGPGPLLARYVEAVGKHKLGGPTNFAPVINKTTADAAESRRYHVLVILCDGAISGQCKGETIDAIVRASNEAPLSIIVVGLGDGPWDQMKELDNMRGRSFDNLCFVAYDKAIARGNLYFAQQALRELPRQYREMCELGRFEGRARSPYRRRALAGSAASRR